LIDWSLAQLIHSQPPSSPVDLFTSTAARAKQPHSRLRNSLDRACHQTVSSLYRLIDEWMKFVIIMFCGLEQDW